MMASTKVFLISCFLASRMGSVPLCKIDLEVSIS